MVKKRTIYTTSDGKEFDNEKEAKEHDEKVIRESIKVYNLALIKNYKNQFICEKCAEKVNPDRVRSKMGNDEKTV